ncbi:MAG: hypothetical protein ABIH82_00060 [Candidatus Woesearchaeota archaeon]
MNKIIILITLILSLALIGCSSNDQITGDVVTSKASLLQIKVLDESGEIVPEAEIYLNDIFKGKTSKYGESKGTKLVILDGDKNIIYVEKEGYFSSYPTSISAISIGGEQRITITLEKERTNLLVTVIDENEQILEGTTVSLHAKENFPSIKDVKTNEEGLADLGRVDDNTYFIKAHLNGYESSTLEVYINFNSDNEKKNLQIKLIRLPHLDIEVIDNENNPLSSTEITLYSKDDFNTPGANPLHISFTDNEGKISYEDVELGEDYIVILKRVGFEAQTHEFTLDNDNQHLKVDLTAVQEE